MPCVPCGLRRIFLSMCVDQILTRTFLFVERRTVLAGAGRIRAGSMSAGFRNFNFVGIGGLAWRLQATLAWGDCAWMAMAGNAITKARTVFSAQEILLWIWTRRHSHGLAIRLH